MSFLFDCHTETRASCYRLPQDVQEIIYDLVMKLTESHVYYKSLGCVRNVFPTGVGSTLELMRMIQNHSHIANEKSLNYLEE
jgi:hypothetical protein